MSKKKFVSKKRRQQQARRQKQYMLLGAVVVGLILAGFIVSQFINGDEKDENNVEFIDSGALNLDEYRGQVVMLNFWATWCPPCRAEMPTIQAAYEQYHDQGFTVLAINYAEDRSTILPFVNELNLSLPIVLDLNANVQRDFRIESYPTSIFLDHNGEIYATHSGLISAAQIENYIQQGFSLRDSAEARAD